MNLMDSPFWQVVDRIREVEPRYRREAYGFVMLALGFTVQDLPEARRADPARRHLSGRELLLGLAALARREFGLMAPTVFEEWGVRANEDVGTIVFLLVEHGQLSARPEDRRDDFVGAPDLMTALSEGVDLGVPTERSASRPSRQPPGESP
jgi:uncharacterized repeat protein (TIGR04138 family)